VSSSTRRNLQACHPEESDLIGARKDLRSCLILLVTFTKVCSICQPFSEGTYLIRGWECFEAPKGRANKAQANGLGCERDPIVLWEQALQGRNNQALASADRRLRRLERLVTPLQG